ncbi:CLC2B protein, partial [Calyptomena viridis]|nr:CLC2B protein [Calyptomena viridis]
CPWDWIRHRGGCYLPSRDEGTWEQAQNRCSELGASLAVFSPEEMMEFLSRFSVHTDYWIGLYRHHEGLHWVDGGTYNSSVPVHGSAGCGYLGDGQLGLGSCSSPRSFLCSKARAPP